MAPSLPSSPSPSPSPHPEELVQVDTALAVLSKVNLLAESNALALDIGGSLAKLIYLQPHSARTTAPPLVIHRVDGHVASALSVHVPELNGTLHFFAFETRNVHQLLRFIRGHWLTGTDARPGAHRLIRATGGGSYKYAATFESEIGVTLARLDEMSCTVAGLNFLLTTVRNEVYVYVPPTAENGRRDASPGPPADFTRTTQFVDTNCNPFPYLLVNIGSGVSIVKVTAHDTFERVSGSSLGGGTFWGLARMLLDCATFDDVIRLTHDGDNSNVDMLVGDIYGGAYASLGLDASVIAASFGKATMRNDYTRPEQSSWALAKDRFYRAITGSFELWMSFLGALPVVGGFVRALRPRDAISATPVVTGMSSQFRPQDVALALLRMVSYNIGQIAYLNARVHNLDRIYFGGNFIRNHPYTIADISFAVDFWSAGKTKALFLRHDGYLGAIGAFIGASSASPTKVLEEQRKRKEKAGSSSSKNKGMAMNGPVPSMDFSERDTAEMNGPSAVAYAPVDKNECAADTFRKQTQKPRGSHKRKKNKHSNSEGAATSAPEFNNGDTTMSSFVNSDTAESTNQLSNSDGDWTTVTRIRRKGASKDKST